ncbi:hypothetical protein [Longitalea arenae]|uniref:hypothetical protein n=1 Tax=Longitalea arenae TaxID=2812558 RepID=UPI001966F047|nr:hypothetical protein [Longitalea arenae]
MNGSALFVFFRSILSIFSDRKLSAGTRQHFSGPFYFFSYHLILKMAQLKSFQAMENLDRHKKHFVTGLIFFRLRKSFFDHVTALNGSQKNFCRQKPINWARKNVLRPVVKLNGWQKTFKATLLFRRPV